MDICLVNKRQSLAMQSARLALSASELAALNDLDTSGPLPCGMALALPSKAQAERHRTELFICHGRDCRVLSAELMDAASYVSMARSMGENEPAESRQQFCTMARDFSALPILSLNNLDEQRQPSPQLAHELLNDTVQQERFIDTLILELERDKWAGLRLDMEYLFPFDREAYTDFACRLGDKLHRAGLWLMATLPGEAVWRPESRAGAAYDILALGEICERLIFSPNGVWGAEKLRAALEKLSEKIAPGKLILDIHAAGELRRSESVESIEAAAAHNLAVSANAAIGRRAMGEPAFFSCLDAAKHRCSVVYTDPLWLCGQLDAVRELGLAGIYCDRPYSLCPAGRAIFRQDFDVEKLM